MPKVKKQKIQLNASPLAAIQKGIVDAETLVDEALQPVRDIYNLACMQTPLELGGENIRLCNQLADILEPGKKISITHMVGVALIGFAVFLDLLDGAWLFTGWIPYAAFLNLAASVIAGITLTYWLGLIGLLFGWEVIVDVIALIFPTISSFLLILALLPSSILIIVAWWILFRRTGKFRRHITTGSRVCGVCP